ncbi:MAG: M55 family metallopeptidase [Candidatus Cloacimonadaceae bacterium]|jgi:D-amino peptidase|nr:M55 family metallopeptidase [Candidatus Cloacimonadota bacterium]MDX9949876.1 M55 family metallopeptidase [Candidatus Syntrophosphaera sp.]
MRIYISIDMEGMPGTYNWNQEKTDRPAVKACVEHHVKTALEAALNSPQAKQIEEITIADSHADGDNLSFRITELDSRINLISGCPRPRYMMPELSAEYSQVWLLGYHSGTGALKGNMDHTYSNSRIHNIWINGKPMNETLINSAYAGFLGIPVTLVSGDETLQKELAAPMPWLEYVATKRAVAKFSALNYSRLKVDELTREAVQKALAKSLDDIPLYSFEAPITLRIEFNHTSMAEQASLMPHTKRLDGRTLEYVADDYEIVFEAIMAMVWLASTTSM